MYGICPKCEKFTHAVKEGKEHYRLECRYCGYIGPLQQQVKIY